MGDLLEEMAADKIGPKTGGIAVYNVPDTANHQFPVANDLPRSVGRIVAIIADKDIYYKWGSATDTVDNTATGVGATVGFLLPAGSMDEHVPTGTHLIVQASAACKIRIAITSGRSRGTGG